MQRSRGPLQPGGPVATLGSPFGAVAPQHFSSMAVTGSVAMTHGFLPLGTSRPMNAHAARDAVPPSPAEASAGGPDPADDTKSQGTHSQFGRENGPENGDVHQGRQGRSVNGRVPSSPSLVLLDVRVMPGMEGGPVCDEHGCLVGVLLQPLLQADTQVEVGPPTPPPPPPPPPRVLVNDLDQAALLLSYIGTQIVHLFP